MIKHRMIQLLGVATALIALASAAPPADAPGVLTPSRNTSTGKSALAGTWSGADGKTKYYFDWPRVVTTSVSESAPNQDGKPPKAKSSKPVARQVRVTEWTFTFDLETRDRVTVHLNQPNPSRVTATSIDSYALQFEFSPDFTFAMVTQDIGRAGTFGPFKFTWSGNDKPPEFAASDTIVWTTPEEVYPKQYHKKTCPLLKGKRKLVSTTIEEARRKCSACDECNSHLK
jgi:hypothetical protein